MAGFALSTEEPADDFIWSAALRALYMLRFMTLGACRCIVAMMLVFCHSGCRESVAPPMKEAALEPPLKSMRLDVDTRRMVVYLMPDVSLGAVVDLGVFGPFRPGVSLEGVSRSYGEPKTVRRDHAGTYYEYSHGDTRIELAHERSMSGDAVWEQWAVYAYPVSHSTDLLSTPLAKLIDAEHPSEVILVGSGDPMVSLQFAAGRLSMMLVRRLSR